MKTIVVEVIVKKDGKILMVQENRKEKKGKWNMPAGKVEDNEDIISAAIREVKEETNINVDIKSLVCIEENVSEKGQLLVLYFIGEYISGNIKYDNNEISNVMWMTPRQINDLKLENIRGGKTINNVIKFSNKTTLNLDRIMIENNL